MTRKPFLGYGSPEALEGAITEGDGPDFRVHEGLCFATVCTPLLQAEVVARMERRPCGTTPGWRFSREPFSDESLNPCPCDRDPETHRHYLFVC